MNYALGLMEIPGWSPAMVILDTMEKTSGIRVLQTELNDAPGVCLKFSGTLGDVEAALEAGRALAAALEVECVSDLIAAPAEGSSQAYEAAADFNPLIEQATVQIPGHNRKSKEKRVSEAAQSSFAVGLIETQGFTAVFEAVDTACKAANVEVLAREKLGGGYITVILKGDVAAVNTAIDAARSRLEAVSLGRLIATHVIPSPSREVLSLLPK